MKLKELKNQLVKVCLGLVIIGSVTMIIGFALSGFDINKYKTDQKPWYQTVTIVDFDLEW